MTAEMRSRLDRLRAISPRLNQATTEAGKMIEATERFLAELSLGISSEVSVDYRPTKVGVDIDTKSVGAGRDEINVVLVYGKLGGTFRFYIREDLVKVNDEEEWIRDVEILNETPWSSCPREVKLKSFEHLPRLLDSMVDQAEKLSALAEGTADVVSDLIGEGPGQAEAITPEAQSRDNSPPGVKKAGKSTVKRRGRRTPE